MSVINKKILEITVDRNNEKGAGAFEYILIVIHRLLEKKPKYFSKRKYSRPSFSFEIISLGNKIRFFLVTEEKYINFIKNQIYAHYSDIEINEVSDYLKDIPDDKITIGKIFQEKHYLYPIKNFSDLQDSSVNESLDPYSSITGALNKASSNTTLNLVQINFSPIRDKEWKKSLSCIYKVLKGKYPKIIKDIILSKHFYIIKIFIYPFILIGRLVIFFIEKSSSNSEEVELPENPKNNDSSKNNKQLNFEESDSTLPLFLQNKMSSVGYGTDINLVYAGDDDFIGKNTIKEIFSTLGIYSTHGLNGFRFGGFTKDILFINSVKSRQCKDSFILNSKELSGLIHLPTNYVKTPSVNWVLSRTFEPPSNLPIIENEGDNLTPIGKTNFRASNIAFGIGPSDRRRHIYVVGKTGMGKSTLLENMIIDDIRKGRGVAVVDPHGDLAKNIIGFIPKNRTNQVIVFDPTDKDWPIAFNMLEDISPEHRSLVASGLVGIFKKIFGDSWGPRLEHILRNTILALLEYQDTTLISIPLMLTSDIYRNKVVNKITDPVVKKFWTGEFAKFNPMQRTEAISPILNKVGQFLSSSILRNILGQSKNSFSLRWAMDNKRIIIVNLSKGEIGEDASSLLGAMIITKFQLEAMSRADILEKDRKDFYLYVDEFQNFATDSFATILSEARKYKLNLVMANQFIDQMTEQVKGAVFGNVGTTISFQVGYHDANLLKDVFGSDMMIEDLTNLRKYAIYMKLLTDGMPSKIFSANTLPPYTTSPEEFATRYEKIQKVSREKYGRPREFVENKIKELINDIDVLEDAWEKKKEEFKKNKK